MRFAVLATYLIAAAAARGGDARVVVSLPHADLGTLDQRAVLERSAITFPLRASVTATSNWTVFAAIDGSPAFDRIEVRRAGEVIEPTPGAAMVAVVSGEKDASLLPVELRIVVGIDAQPGPRKVRIRFGTAPDQLDQTVDVTYTVPVITYVEPDNRPFVSPAVNPARNGIYPYERRTYTVRSNVPWIVEAVLEEVPKREDARSMPPDSIGVVMNDAFHPFVASTPLVVEAGPATEGRAVALDLAVRISDELVVGGEYRTSVRVYARAAESASGG